MQRTRVKICGVARVEDAVMAASAGADAIGFALWPRARRAVSVERAKQIVQALPPFVTPVALFVDAEARAVLDVTEELRVRTVQLNGQETPEQVAELQELTVIKAVRVEAQTLAGELARWRDAIGRLNLSNLHGIVLETGGTKQPGGTGIENDWGAIRRSQEAGDFQGLPPITAAGGLTCESVANVVRELRPWAVDVSSGVESFMGHKSQEKVQAFIAAVREASCHPQPAVPPHGPDTPSS